MTPHEVFLLFHSLFDEDEIMHNPELSKLSAYLSMGWRHYNKHTQDIIQKYLPIVFIDDKPFKKD